MNQSESYITSLRFFFGCPDQSGIEFNLSSDAGGSGRALAVIFVIPVNRTTTVIIKADRTAVVTYLRLRPLAVIL